jgi:hypothetical protein
MIVLPRERSIDLRQRKVRMILLNGFGAPTLSQMIKDRFDDFDAGVVNPREALLIQPNVRHRNWVRDHASLVTAASPMQAGPSPL